MQRFFIHWMITSVGVLAAAHTIPGISYTTVTALLVASLVLGLVNALVKPLLMIMSLPLILMTFGLFIVVINGFLLLLVSHLVPGFKVAGWGSALLGSFVISIITLLLKGFSKPPSAPRRPPNRKTSSSSEGKIIDV